MAMRDVTTGKLPPGQTTVEKFPVVGEKAPRPEALDLRVWRLEVAGLVQQPLSFTYDEILDIAQQELRADIHCVTSWSKFGMTFRGIPLADVLARARPASDVRFVRFESYSPVHHDTSLPLDLARADTWLVHSVDGAPLTIEHGWPLRTVTPSRYFYKSVKWVHRIELLQNDQLGTWERESAYHNNADPWPGNERYSSGSIKPGALEAFRSAENFDPFRRKNRPLIGVDLRGWRPATPDLAGLQIKNSDMREANFEGADLRNVNLTLSDLRRANLRNANLEGADLEGVNLAGADLTGANLDNCALTVTRFFEIDEQGHRLDAHVAGISWRQTTGLLPEQEAFLRDRS